MHRSRSRRLICFFFGPILLLLAGLSIPTPLEAADLPPARGRMLIADESIRDPRFRQTVILLLQHDRRGSVGLIVNRATKLEAKRALPDASAFPQSSGAIFYGGPVEPGSLVVLLKSAAPPERSTRICEGVHLTGVEELAAWLRTGREPKSRFGIFSGYAGWAPGQLDAELARGDWRVHPAADDLVFPQAPGALWFDIQGGGKRDWI